MRTCVYVISAFLLIVAFNSDAVGQCRRELKLHSYKTWLYTTNIPAGGMYFASSKRRERLELGYVKISVGFSRIQVARILGPPDFSEPQASPTIPRAGTLKCRYQWYIIQKRGSNLADGADRAIYLLFSEKDKLLWAAPQKLALIPLGVPPR